MRERCLIGLIAVLCLSIPVFTQIWEVQSGSTGNRLTLTVENRFGSRLQGVHVSIVSAPPWTFFKTKEYPIESIPAGELRDAIFQFEVSDNVQTGETDSIELSISDSFARVLATRVILVRAAGQVGETTLEPAYPNPANPEATIRYGLSVRAHVRLEIYNILGQRVRTLVDEEKARGRWVARWDGRNDQGFPVSSGLYFVRMVASEGGKIKHLSTKILLQR